MSARSPAASRAAPAAVIIAALSVHSRGGGMCRRSPWLAGAFALFLLSMAGIPLTAGFIAKFTAFGAAITGPDGQGGGATWVLAVVGVLASAVAVFFYVRIIVLMFFTPPADAPDPAAEVGSDAGAAPRAVGVTVVRSNGPAAVAIALCAIGVLVLGVFPSPVLDLAAEAVKFVP